MKNTSSTIFDDSCSKFVIAPLEIDFRDFLVGRVTDNIDSKGQKSFTSKFNLVFLELSKE